MSMILADLLERNDNMKKLVTSIILIAFLFVTPVNALSNIQQQSNASSDFVLGSNIYDSFTEYHFEDENRSEKVEADQNITTYAAASGISSGMVYNIKNVGSGKYLNVHYGVDANATNVYQWTADGSTEQKFKVVYSSETDSYKIYAMCSSNGTNRVLDVVRNGTALAHGQNVDIWTPIDATAQEMVIIPLGENQYRIAMKANQNLYLAAFGNLNGTSGGTSSTSSGNVYLSNYVGEMYQHWMFEPVSSSVTQPSGWLDIVSSDSISGWAWRSDIPNSPIDVHIYITNIATNQQWGYPITANLFRQDLANAGYGNGYHGFNFGVNWANYPAGNYSVVAYGIGGNNPALSGCPITYSNTQSDTFSNSINKGCSWVVPLDSGVVAGVGYRVESNCYVKTTTLTGRIANEVSSFAKTDKNLNPEIDLPTITIGTTKINQNVLSMTNNTNVWASTDWIWKCAVSYPNIAAPHESEFSSIVICMLNGAIYPYQSVTNSYVF